MRYLVCVTYSRIGGHMKKMFFRTLNKRDAGTGEVVDSQACQVETQ